MPGMRREYEIFYCFVYYVWVSEPDGAGGHQFMDGASSLFQAELAGRDSH